MKSHSTISYPSEIKRRNAIVYTQETVTYKPVEYYKKQGIIPSPKTIFEDPHQSISDTVQLFVNEF